jgi:hypothetical protein
MQAAAVRAFGVINLQTPHWYTVRIWRLLCMQVSGRDTGMASSQHHFDAHLSLITMQRNYNLTYMNSVSRCIIGSLTTFRMRRPAAWSYSESPNVAPACLVMRSVACPSFLGFSARPSSTQAISEGCLCLLRQSIAICFEFL